MTNLLFLLVASITNSDCLTVLLVREGWISQYYQSGFLCCSMSHYYSDQSYHYDLSHLNYYLQAHMNQNKLNNISFEGEFTTNFCLNYFIFSNLVYSYKWTIKLSQQIKILISLHACEAQQDYFLSQKNKSSQDIILITEGVKVTFFHLAVNIRTVTMNTQTRSYHYG